MVDPPLPDQPDGCHDAVSISDCRRSFVIVPFLSYDTLSLTAAQRSSQQPARDQRQAIPFALALMVFSAFLLFLVPAQTHAQSVPDSPLAPCPDSPNCERVSRTFDAEADTLFRAAQSALRELGPVEITVTEASREAHAVYRVALVFKDDVNLAVTDADSGQSTLHIRSASRVGYSDLGVNRRRVEQFFESLGPFL